MAKYRNIQTKLWTDPKVMNDFAVEEKYMFLYLLTNAHTSICGCYEINRTTMAFETGLTLPKVKDVLTRLENIHNVIRYNEDTNELLLLNWYKHNWTSSSRVRKGIDNDIQNIKCDQFRNYIQKCYSVVYE